MGKHSASDSQLPLMLVGAMVLVCVLMYVLMRSRTGDSFACTKQIPAYSLSLPLPATQYNSLTMFTSQMSCDSCFYYGLQSAQADALYAISVGTATPSQHVLPPTIKMFNAYNADNSAVVLVPLQLALLTAAAKIYGAQLRGQPRCSEYCSDTAADNRMWTQPTSTELAQLWAAVACYGSNATPTQVLLYGAMLAKTPTPAQKSLLEYTSQQIAITDAAMVNPNIAQITLLAASAAITAGTATPAQLSYYKNVTPFLVSQFNSAIIASAGNAATATQAALLASMPPPVSTVPAPALPPIPAKPPVPATPPVSSISSFSVPNPTSSALPALAAAASALSNAANAMSVASQFTTYI